MTIEEQKQQLAQLIRQFNQLGWSPATSTNYSFKESAISTSFWVSMSGKDKAKFTENDFMLVDSNGFPIQGFEQVKPSAETLIHCVLYKLFPYTTCILHSHSLASTVLSAINEASISFQGYEVQKAFVGESSHEATVSIPLFTNTQDMVAFSSTLSQHAHLIKNNSFVMKKHGTYAWGNSFDEAKRHLEALEYLLSCELALKNIQR